MSLLENKGSRPHNSSNEDRDIEMRCPCCQSTWAEKKWLRLPPGAKQCLCDISFPQAKSLLASRMGGRGSHPPGGGRRAGGISAEASMHTALMENKGILFLKNPF
jgi:hypothetical protein